MHDSGGGDIVAAYWALRQKAVLFDVPERPIEISGPGALAFRKTILRAVYLGLRLGGAITHWPAPIRVACLWMEYYFVLIKTGIGLFSLTVI